MHTTLNRKNNNNNNTNILYELMTELMTLSSVFTVDLRKLPQLLPNWNAASQKWTIGCLRTGSS